MKWLIYCLPLQAFLEFRLCFQTLMGLVVIICMEVIRGDDIILEICRDSMSLFSFGK